VCLSCLSMLTHSQPRTALLSFCVTRDERHFGEILTTNEQAGSALNELSSSLVGKPISNFLLQPWSTCLHQIVNKYMATGVSPYIYQPLIAYMGNPDCFEVRVRFIPFTSDGMEYTMYAEFSLTPAHAACYLICTGTGKLVGMNSACCALMEELSEGVSSVTIPECTKLLEDATPIITDLLGPHLTLALTLTNQPNPNQPTKP
jgi:hypothetical protein